MVLVTCTPRNHLVDSTADQLNNFLFFSCSVGRLRIDETTLWSIIPSVLTHSSVLLAEVNRLVALTIALCLSFLCKGRFPI